jgi:hypothetical protein
MVYHDAYISLVFGLLSCLVLSSVASGARTIPDDNLSYPVRITIGGKDIGSGVYLNTQDATFLVTVRHVLYDPPTGKLRGKEAILLAYARDPKDKGRNVFRLDLEKLETDGELKADATHDVAVIRMGKVIQGGDERVIAPVTGVENTEKATSGIVGVGRKNAIQFGEVLVGNDIYIFGYPTSLGLRDIPQIDYERPLLRKGIVAGVNEKTKAIILDCPVYGGNSGGPVLQVEETGLGGKEFRLIGIIKEFVPYAETWLNISQKYSNVTISNSGYSVAVPVDWILDLISSWQR